MSSLYEEIYGMIEHCWDEKIYSQNRVVLEVHDFVTNYGIITGQESLRVDLHILHVTICRSSSIMISGLTSFCC